MKRLILIIMLLFISASSISCTPAISSYDYISETFNHKGIEAYNKSKDIALQVFDSHDNVNSVVIKDYYGVAEDFSVDILFTYEDGSTETKSTTELLTYDEINILRNTSEMGEIYINSEYVFFTRTSTGVVWIQNEYDCKKILAVSDLAPIEDNWYIAFTPETEPSVFLWIVFLSSAAAFLVGAVVISVIVKYYYVFFIIVILIILLVIFIYKRNKRKIRGGYYEY